MYVESSYVGEGGREEVLTTIVERMHEHMVENTTPFQM